MASRSVKRHFCVRSQHRFSRARYKLRTAILDNRRKGTCNENLDAAPFGKRAGLSEECGVVGEDLVCPLALAGSGRSFCLELPAAVRPI